MEIDDAAPGDQDADEQGVGAGVRNYLIGFFLAAAFTVASFWVASGTSVGLRAGRGDGARGACHWPDGRAPGIFPAHHHRFGQHQQRALALAFGVLIVGIVIAGSLWIMYHLNMNMMMPHEMLDMHTQPLSVAASVGQHQHEAIVLINVKTPFCGRFRRSQYHQLLA